MKWVRAIAFGLGFAIVILRLDTINIQPRRKTYVVLGWEKDDKYRKYKKDIDKNQKCCITKYLFCNIVVNLECVLEYLF